MLQGSAGTPLVPGLPPARAGGVPTRKEADFGGGAGQVYGYDSGWSLGACETMATSPGRGKGPNSRAAVSPSM